MSDNLNDSDFDPSECDFFYTKFYPRSSKFGREFLPGDEMFMMLLDDPKLSNANCIDYGDIDPNSLKYELGLEIWRMPKYIWHIFESEFPAHLKPAIKLVATLLHLLLPKNNLCFTPTYDKWATQLNDLWERLTPLLQAGQGVHVALSCIMNLTNDRDKYSLVTETDVSQMIGYYCDRLQFSSFSCPLHPYKHNIGREFEREDSPWFKEIMQVIDEIEMPPTLQSTDHSLVLIKIVEGEGRDDVLRRLDFELAPYYEESSPLFLKIGFENILNRVIHRTKNLIIHHLAYVLEPLDLCRMGYESDISREVFSIISVAEVRRIALGCRFISRSHLLWAFYERGYVLPPQIRQTIKSISAEENHPPFHIYMASLELAKLLSGTMGLEHFIFSVINSDDFGKTVHTDEMKKFIPCYKEFLNVLDNQSSNSFHSVRKRLRSGELKL